MEIIHSKFPGFQKASVDEAFIDVTEKVFDLMQQDKIEFNNQNEPLVKWSKQYETCVLNIPANGGDNTSNQDDRLVQDSSGWKDLQLFYASIISKQLRKEIWDQLGYTSSTGIAHNKTLAKLISSTNKPNKQTCLLDSFTMEYMKTTKLSKIRGMGGKFGDKLIEEFMVEMASDLWPKSLESLQKALGVEEGTFLIYSQKTCTYAFQVNGPMKYVGEFVATQ